MGGDHPHRRSLDDFDLDDITQCIDDIVNSGTLPNGVAWGITSRQANEYSTYGFAMILVDSFFITAEIIEQLIQAGVITHDDEEPL